MALHFKHYLLIAALWLLTLPSIQAAPLSTNQAYQFTATLEHQQLQLHWTLAPGYQLYRARIHVAITSNSQVKLGTFERPLGIPQYDPIIGHYQVYRDQLQLSIPLQHYQPDEFQIQVDYQGCSQTGFCYPPQHRQLTIQISPFGGQVQSIETIIPKEKPIHSIVTRPHHSMVITLLTFFGLGILLAFTPCVLPMLPILSAIIVGERRTTQQAFLLSLTYVIAMAMTYAICGLLIGLFDKNIQASLQAPWILIAFAALFVVLALSLFGLYDLRLPYRLQQWLNSLNQRQQGGRLLSAALMGILSTLIVSPCVSAPLIGALAYITETQQTLMGGIILFVMGLGMGLPLLIAGTLEGRFLPRSGPWMEQIKTLFGVLMLMTAVWLLYRLLPPYLCLILWGLILVISSIYLGAFALKAITRKTLLWKGLLWLGFILGVIFIIGGLGHNQDPMHPLHSKAPATSSFLPIKTVSQLQQTLTKAHGKTVLIDVYANWCIACQRIDQTIFNQPAVQTLLKKSLLLRIDVTHNTIADQALEKYLQVFAPPTLIFYNAQGQEIKTARLVGDVSLDTFIHTLKTKVLTST